MWVLSHIGIKCNELVGKAAIQATKILLSPRIKNITSNDTILLVRKEIHLTWRNYWDAIPTTN